MALGLTGNTSAISDPSVGLELRSTGSGSPHKTITLALGLNGWEELRSTPKISGARRPSKGTTNNPLLLCRLSWSWWSSLFVVVVVVVVASVVGGRCLLS